MAKSSSYKIQPASSPVWTIKKLSIILAVITFVLYANTLQNCYVLDDVTVTIKNSIVTQGFKGIPEILTTSRLKGYEQTTDAESYRPLPLILSAIEYQLQGNNATEGHFANIVLFIGCVLALFVFFCKMFPHKQSVAFIAALLFALHPIHTEVVANIKSRDELMCFLFAFLALNALIDYAQNGKLLRLLTGACFLFLSFLSKETVISFLLVIPFVFFFYINENKKRSSYVTAATILVVAAFLAIRTAVLGSPHTNAILFIPNPLVAAPDIASRIATAVLVLGMYLKLLAIPYPLVCDYSYSSIPAVGFGNVWVILSLTAYLLLVSAGIYRLIKIRKDAWAFAALFFLITIALFSNIPFLVYSEMAERFVFSASAGFCLLMALAYERYVIRTGMHDFPVYKNTRVLITLVPVCLLFALLTLMRNADWKDNYTLFSTDLKKSGNNCQLYFYLGTEISQNKYAEETDPSSKLEMDQESIGYLNRAIEIYPGFSAAHAELGRIYERLQLLDSAIVHDSKAIAINPGNAIATYNLGRAYYFKKDYPKTIELFKKTLVMQPSFALGFLNLARCYADSKQYDSAIVYFNKTLSLDPGQQLAKQGLSEAVALRNTKDTTTKSSEIK